MSDLKEFWEEQHKINDKYCLDKNVWNINYTIIETLKERQGLFFWERGGKWFVKNELIPNLPPEIDLYKYLVRRANEYISDDTKVVLNYSFKAKDFLDSIVFLGEDKVKELIKKEGV
jgi:hypothetical protein